MEIWFYHFLSGYESVHPSLLGQVSMGGPLVCATRWRRRKVVSYNHIVVSLQWRLPRHESNDHDRDTEWQRSRDLYPLSEYDADTNTHFVPLLDATLALHDYVRTDNNNNRDDKYDEHCLLNS